MKIHTPIYNEADIENGCVAYARRYGWKTWKLSAHNDIGTPDRVFILGKQGIIVEFKQASGKLGPLQEENGRQLLDDGCEYYLVTTPAQADRFKQLLRRRSEKAKGVSKRRNKVSA
ncbi:MAG: hypothetical protein OXU36_10670 [Candidatus Poribacteria bacterium]|nr:hypothetical protein [Candidatus Poribacteria bacterium]